MRRAWALGVLVMAIAPGVAGADTTINFDSPTLGECTVVTSQFAGVSLSGSGSTFLRTSGVNHSGTQSLQTGGGVGCGEPDVQPHPMMALASTYASASIWVRQEGGAEAIGYRLQAFDTSGSRIDTNGSGSPTLPPPTTTDTQPSAGTARK